MLRELACRVMAPGPSCLGRHCTYSYLPRDFVPDAIMDPVLLQLPWVPDAEDDCCDPACDPETGPQGTVELHGGLRIGVDASLDLTHWNGAITVDTAALATREPVFATMDGEALGVWDACMCGYEIDRPDYYKPERVELGVQGNMRVQMRSGLLDPADWFDTTYEVSSRTCVALKMQGGLWLAGHEDEEFPKGGGSTGARLHYGAGGRVVDQGRSAHIQAPAGTTLRYRILDVVRVSASGGATVDCDGMGVAIKLPKKDGRVEVTVSTASDTYKLRIQVCPDSTS